jgi:hypothetical protein
METDKFYVLDFDRCIGDTNGIQAVLERVIQEEMGISPEMFHAARTRIESEGKTFATIRHVHELLKEAGSNVTWEHIRDKLIEAAKKEELLLPHARDLLRILGEKGLHHGIITYGVEETWQLTKLEITGLLNVPHLVTQIEQKGEILTGWKREDGKFDVPPALGSLVARHLVFLDDKAKSFWGIPEGVEGVHVIAPGGNTLPAQQGNTPDSVTEVTGIDGAIELLFSEEYSTVS